MAMPFKLTNEPDWPNSKICPRYSLAPLGGEPNQSLAASALVPRSVSGQANITARVVLRHMIWRLNIGNVRRLRRDDAAFGQYRFIWFPQDKLAIEMGLSVHQVKRELESLTKSGIIYRVRRGTSEANSYRLTDPAFKLMHLMQWPVLHYRADGNIEFAGKFEAAYRNWFPLWVAAPDTQEMLANWHGSKTAKGDKLDPEAYGFAQPIWDASHDYFINSKAGKEWQMVG